jgi:lysophospholipase L1-like esterase
MSKKRLCVWGSSIARGTGDEAIGGWVERLRRDFEKSPVDVRVYNLGISGDTSSGLVKRFSVEYDARNPEIVLIAIGLNDSSFFTKKTKPRVDLKTYEKNLGFLYKKAKKKSKVLFVTLTPVDESKVMPVPWRTEIYYSNDMIEKYNSALKKFCVKNSIPLIDLEGILKIKDLGDGLHPNSTGHKKMHLAIKKFLLENKIV